MSDCMTRIGETGNLFPVRVAALSSETDRPVSFTDTLGSRKAFLGRRGRRSWLAERTTSDPAELSHIEWWARHQSRPLVFHPPGAAVTNLLDPDTAGLAAERISASAEQGPMVRADGLVLPSVFPGGDVISMVFRSGSLDPIPVAAGEPVTVSAWQVGAASIAVSWRDATGASIATDSASVGTSRVLTRRHRTVWPPPGAVQMTLQFFGAQLAGPAVTLTRDLRPWQTGAGAVRVVISGFQQEILHVPETGVPIKSVKYTITEVG